MTLPARSVHCITTHYGRSKLTRSLLQAIRITGYNLPILEKVWC